MFLNKEFLELYEELSILNEAKADTQKLIDFAGEDLANRFLTIKNRLKAPKNDLYYWIRQGSPEELEAVVTELETTKSKTLLRKEAVSGGDLVYESEHWKVYHITTFEASQFYGRDTRWCITGIDGNSYNYWTQYHDTYNIDFYFLITKGAYNPRGTDSKFAIAIKPDNTYEAFDQQDRQIAFSNIPYIDEINYPRFNSLITLFSGYYAAVDKRNSNKVAHNKDISYEEASNEIMSFISSLSQEEKDNMRLSWNLYTTGTAVLYHVATVWSQKELKRSKRVDRVLCDNEDVSKQLKRALNIID